MNKRQHFAILGGGAAGFFAAIRCAALLPSASVSILEKSSRVLVKVKVSGGGRCNVTHACYDNRLLVGNYPRGNKKLMGLFSRFGPADTVNWFLERGVVLKTEEDGRMFPITDNSQTIIDCLVNEAQRTGVTVELNRGVREILPKEEGFDLLLDNGEKRTVNKVLVATGGSPAASGLDWIRKMGLRIVPPVPSLFSFNIRTPGLKELMGCSVQQAQVAVKGNTPVQGPLLITHWGMSGPAILRLSSEYAPQLATAGYRFALVVKWIPDETEETVRETFTGMRSSVPTQHVSRPLFQLPRRLWDFLAFKAGLDPEIQWANMSNEKINRLLNVLLRDEYAVEGKTTFKEEFVTCGGVSLDEIDMKTMECRKLKGLYFAGEVLDIDAVTGGFNFQAAWSAGFVAGTAMAGEGPL